MGETNQEGTGTPGRRPPRPAPTPPATGSAVLTPPLGLPAVDTPAPSLPAQRTSPDPITAPDPVRDTPPAVPSVAVRVCTCGHPEDMHEHYRAGDDCGACGARVCASFADRDAPAAPPLRLFRRRRR